MSHRLSIAMNEKTPSFQRRRSSSISHRASMQLFSSGTLSNILSQRNEEEEDEEKREMTPTHNEVKEVAGKLNQRKRREHKQKNKNSKKERKKKRSRTA
eukprot:CAMPEP_0202708760 /NCGR_PEP_ID=MMETSP1385-20130828/20925_1 /ASSEMBLY_ACC=CAM_ASM_000861 /TAXON_ID=933848 /ORGANISM="Elphidium margaritaceum" /LENGTH=98 /DNA_ID=CAMNT_0049367825 /DNA_START=102 /DNA_END=395 /DNA_ORIENTATION=+